MSCLLAFDCSLRQGGLVLLEIKNLKCLIEKKWEAQISKASHSDLLPLKILESLEEAKLSLKDLSFLAVGGGPGRFTGIRTALCAAKSLSYSLKIPVYSINSLKVIAKSFSDSQFVCVALQAFKNQVYYGEFGLGQEASALLSFKSWRNRMKHFVEPVICLSDLEKFYPIKKESFPKVQFRRPQVSALALAQTALKPGAFKQSWNQLKANYMRSNF